MIDVQHAVQSAMNYLATLPSDLLPSTGVRLEEFEFDDRQNEWQITLSFVENPITMIRSYKVFVVDGSLGVVKAMRMRNPYAKV